ncbi:hypothetical protein QBC40DRAFT_314623 [Triangularia verruculosa]|uniref:Uncharacterized protein n=1 Tax=Triangularia verruculosa TaxID=2587418 RepID=A0AAN6XAV8_9PEZI|nr:hypothetical protein QBC40DRAFT_314623 [Triangularia verruculosa]
MDLLELDPSPTILVLITLHFRIYTSASSTEIQPAASSCANQDIKLPLISSTTFAHTLKTKTPSVTHFLRSIDTICLNHIFFSRPQILHTAVKSYQATSSIVWNTAPSTFGPDFGEVRRLPIHNIPSSSHLSEQLEMMRLRGHIDTILVEMAIEVDGLHHTGSRLGERETGSHGENKEEILSNVKAGDDDSNGHVDLDFRGLAKECLSVLQRMEAQSAEDKRH